MNQQHPRTPSRGGARQRGSFAAGLTIGLLIGLALALGVALYVTKVPVPFINKVPQRTPVQDAAETEKNRNWDPNGPLYGKNPVKPSPGGTAALPPLTTSASPVPGTLPGTLPGTTPTTSAAAAPAASASPTGADGTAANRLPSRASDAGSGRRDPAAVLAERAASAPRSAASASGNASADPFTYFVQAGAFAQTEDAEQQRARLAMMGMEGRTSEREQSGRTVFRVRVGPFSNKADADAAKEKLAAAGVDASLVRIQR